MRDEFIQDLFMYLNSKKNTDQTLSYTSSLINNHEFLAKKLGEETSELIIDFIKKNKKGVVNESADLIYHLLVAWVSVGVSPNEIWDELSKRRIQSGFEEKQKRGKLNE